MSLDRIRRRWRALFRRNEMERELEAELRFHLERDTAENLGRGMSAEEARFAALRSFGGVDQSREECRDARGVRLLQEFWWDLRFGLRMLLKQPGFTCVAVVTLALGIGANTAIFSVVNSVLLRQLPFKSPDQLMWVWSSRTDKDNAPFSLPDFLDYRDQNQTLEQIAAFSNIGLSLTGIERTERLQGLRVSANLFQLLGVDASAGRVLIPEDDQPARRHVVVLSHECWQRRFGSDPQMVGKPLKLNGESYEIVGILPQQFDLPIREAEVAIPLAPEVDPLRNVRASVNFLRAVARLKPGVTRQQAQADLTAVVLRERQQFGEAYLKKTAAGLMVAAWGVRFLLALSPTQLPREQEIGIDLKVLAFAVVASVGAAVIFGILPALHGARSEMIGGLRAGGRGAGEGARRNRSRSFLVVAEVALSFLLLISAELLIQSFMRVQAIEPGFDPANAMAIRLSLPKLRYPNRAAVALFYDKLLPRIQALPDVEAVGTISILPLSGGLSSSDFTLAGRALTPSDAHTSQFRAASPDYFRAMKIPLLQGRPFDEHDNARSVPVVLINETMARRFWPKADAIGAQINIDDNNTGPRPVEIVGVVGNVKHLNLESEPTFDVYLPIAQIHEDNVGLVTNTHYWIVRFKTNSQTVEAAFRRELQNVDPDVATSNIKTLDDYISDSVAPRRFNLRVLTIFSVAALLLAATGIYGIVSYTVTQRTPEMGIRLALGAGRTEVFRLILGQGLKVVLFGVALGLIGALAVTRVIRSLLFGTTPNDPLTFVVVSLLLMLVALIACSVPARRATKVDPLIALRNE